MGGEDTVLEEGETKKNKIYTQKKIQKAKKKFRK